VAALLRNNQCRGMMPLASLPYIGGKRMKFLLRLLLQTVRVQKGFKSSQKRRGVGHFSYRVITDNE
jgi:hypothetical protein